MTTPPQGPWGPGQPGGQPGGQSGGQGGWGQQPGEQPGQGGGWGQGHGQPQHGQPPYGQPQHGQPQHGQPPYGQQPPQQGGGGGWGNQPGQQPGQGGGGWGQPPGQQPPPYGGYPQQPWNQQGSGQQGWHQQQGGRHPWNQQGGPGGQGPGGSGKDKLPLLIGGGVVGVLLIGLLIFLGIRALGGDDEPTADPTANPTGTTSEPAKDPSGPPANATGQAKTATEKLTKAEFTCSDLFNGPQGAHRGCFKYSGATEAEVVFQFQADGTVIGVQVRSADADNVNNAAVTFDAALQAIGNDTFGGSEVAKIQEAVKTGQKTNKVGSTWGEFDLRNDGDSLRLSGGKSGSDSLELPRKEFQTTEAALNAALKAKGYECTSSCRKKVGKYGSQSIFGIGSNGGIRSLSVRVSGDSAEVKSAMPAATADLFAVVKGPDVAVLKAWVTARSDGKSHAGYVSGWRVEMTGDSGDSFSSQTIEISYESFYV